MEELVPLNTTAMLMLGMQKDHFAKESVIRNDLEDSGQIDLALEQTMTAAEKIASRGGVVIHIPIQFSSNYKEMEQPFGILATVRSKGLLQAGQPGTMAVDDLGRLSCKVETVMGRTRVNAFRGTDLDDLLGGFRIRRVLLSGASTATSIDATARTAYELGYEVAILRDCIVSRSQPEHDLYCGMIFPQYAAVVNSTTYYETET